jgi:hypothetical protein
MKCFRGNTMGPSCFPKFSGVLLNAANAVYCTVFDIIRRMPVYYGGFTSRNNKTMAYRRRVSHSKSPKWVLYNLTLDSRCSLPGSGYGSDFLRNQFYKDFLWRQDGAFSSRIKRIFFVLRSILVQFYFWPFFFSVSWNNKHFVEINFVDKTKSLLR